MGSLKEEVHDYDSPGGQTSADYVGVEIDMDFDCTLTAVEVFNGCTATKITIYLESDKSSLATSNLSSNVATFNLALTNGVKYYVVAHADGAGFVNKWGDEGEAPGFTIDLVRFDVPHAVYNSGGGWNDYSGHAWAIRYITTNILDYTTFQANIGDAWKSLSGMQINIGDVWKDVIGCQINIGDAWKTVF